MHRKSTEAWNKRKNGIWTVQSVESLETRGKSWSGNFKKELVQLLTDWVMQFWSQSVRETGKNVVFWVPNTEKAFGSKYLNSVVQPPVAVEVAC